MAGQPKRPKTVRLSPAGCDRITARAERADVDFSHMTRRMLAYADRYMPETWTPSQAEPGTTGKGLR
jgi:hypothetical protein